MTTVGPSRSDPGERSGPRRPRRRCRQCARSGCGSGTGTACTAYHRPRLAPRLRHLDVMPGVDDQTRRRLVHEPDRVGRLPVDRPRRHVDRPLRTPRLALPRPIRRPEFPASSRSPHAGPSASSAANTTVGVQHTTTTANAIRVELFIAGSSLGRGDSISPLAPRPSPLAPRAGVGVGTMGADSASDATARCAAVDADQPAVQAGLARCHEPIHQRRSDRRPHQLLTQLSPSLGLPLTKPLSQHSDSVTRLSSLAPRIATAPAAHYASLSPTANAVRSLGGLPV